MERILPDEVDRPPHAKAVSTAPRIRVQLNSSEIEQLRRSKAAIDDYARKAFTPNPAAARPR